MPKPVSNIRRLLNDQAGVVAMIVALATPMLMGAAALSIDITHFNYVQSRLQAAADSAALAAIVKLDTPTTAVADAVDFASRNVPSGFGAVTKASDVQIGIWDPDAKTFTVATGDEVNAVRVAALRETARGNAVGTIVLQYFGASTQAVGATAIAARQLIVQYEPPERTILDSEAGDFNEMYVYCFNYQGTGPAESRRSQEVLIANNMKKGDNIIAMSGGVINAVPQDPLDWPECEKGESLSFRMRNVRHAKSMSDLWANPGKAPGRPEFNYYTDTVISGGVETFGGLSTSILETVRCDTADKCDPGKSGNIINSGKNRTPDVSSVPCLPGKFMYFGWEDRPPGQSGKSGNWTDPAWTDRDYDDIRILMRCPKTGRLGDGMSRLVG